MSGRLCRCGCGETLPPSKRASAECVNKTHAMRVWKRARRRRALPRQRRADDGPRRAKLGRRCRSCHRTDDEALWSTNTDLCGACQRRKLRNGACGCGAALYYDGCHACPTDPDDPAWLRCVEPGCGERFRPINREQIRCPDHVRSVRDQRHTLTGSALALLRAAVEAGPEGTTASAVEGFSRSVVNRSARWLVAEGFLEVEDDPASRFGTTHRYYVTRAGRRTTTDG